MTREEGLAKLRDVASYEEARIDMVIDHALQRAEERIEEKSETTENSTQQEIEPQPACELVKYDFIEPAEVAALFIEAINTGRESLHPWQVDISHKLASAKATQHNPFKFCLTACNGSGKDAFVIAPFTLWFALTRMKSLTVITSSSGVQLTSQTENYISSMALKVNKFFGREVFKVIKRFIRCNDTGSEIRLFATDEAGKAEGYHPLEPGAEMAIIVNEAKSVSDDIFQALSRCTGYNYWLEVSTPGEPAGHFYWSNQHYKNKMRITSYDCPHKALQDIEDDKLRYGEHSAIFRSKHLALFTQLGGQFIITATQVEKCLARDVPWIGNKWPLRVGIDVALSNGGDATVVSIWKGNKRIAKIKFYTENITILVDEIDMFLRKNNVPLASETIFIDDGGVGRAAWPLLLAKGWLKINRILNQSRAYNTTEFSNRGAELWFLWNRLVEECLVILPVDDKDFMQQISSRKYSRSKTTGKILLENKAEMKSEGRTSPDDVDSSVLAFCGLTIEDFHQALLKGDAIDVMSVTMPARAFTGKELVEFGARKEVFDADIESFFKKREVESRSLTQAIELLAYHD